MRVPAFSRAGLKLCEQRVQAVVVRGLVSDLCDNTLDRTVVEVDQCKRLLALHLRRLDLNHVGRADTSESIKAYSVISDVLMENTEPRVVAGHLTQSIQHWSWLAPSVEPAPSGEVVACAQVATLQALETGGSRLALPKKQPPLLTQRTGGEPPGTLDYAPLPCLWRMRTMTGSTRECT